jgi:monofunctional biosynthetic peptidoglycan transglycosylase
VPDPAADPEAAEPSQAAVMDALAAPDPERQIPEPLASAEQVAAEPQPEVPEAAAATAPEHQPAAAVAAAEQELQAQAVATTGLPEPQGPALEGVTEPAHYASVEVDAAEAEPGVAEAVAPIEPEPHPPVTAEPQPPMSAAAEPAAEPEPDVADAVQLRIEGQPHRTAAGGEAQLPRADIVSPPVERPGVEAAPQRPAAEATPPSHQRTEPGAPAAVLFQGQAARPAPARLPGSLPSRQAGGEYLPYLRLALQGAAAVAAGLAIIVLTLVVLYRWVDPPTSTLILGQRLAGTPIERRWVPLERISPHLVRAVILSEDGGFCRHRGVDWGAMEEAIENARGGSTITMQVVKNLFLWPSRSYVRKVIEIGLAYLVEAIWPKRRILEIYLNIAEWGDGVFGAEAAARHHFGKSAALLTAAEAALLAVALPSPTERTAGSPSPGMSRLANRLLTRMAISRASVACVRAAPRLVRQSR